MNQRLLNGLAVLAIGTTVGVTTFSSTTPMAQAAFTSAVVSEAGVLRSGLDHFFEVSIEGAPLQRIRVECVTFHELDSVDIFIDGQKVEPDINKGFEEFTLTFNKAVPTEKIVRIVMRNSRVKGVTRTGISIPYRVFGTYPSLNNSEVPIGTAIVQTETGR